MVFSLPVSLVFLFGWIDPRSACWCWRLGSWEEMGGRKVGGECLCDLLGMGSERKEKPQQVSCYRPGDATGGLDLKKQKEGCGSVVSKLIALARIALGVVSGALLGLGVGTKQRVGGQRLEGENLWDLQEKETEEQGRLPKVFCHRAVDEDGAWV